MPRPLPPRPILVLSALLLAVLVASARTDSSRVEAGPDAPTATPGFPEAWRGRWKGTARLVTPAGTAMQFGMELVVEPTETAGRWTWTVVYDGDRGRQERKYHLVAKDVAHGAFEIDEGNGIRLATQFLDGALYGQFVVGETRITSRDRLEAVGTADERISSELITTRDAEPVESGGREGVPEVRTYPVRSLQTATLRRVEARPK